MAEQSFRALIANAHNGDNVAAQAIVNEYTDALVAVARRQIGPRLARRLDPDDVVQSTYRSLFVRMRDGQYELGSGQDLWKLLVTMTLNKVRRQARYHSTQRRNTQLERVGAEFLEGEICDPAPGPSDAAELVDETAALLSEVEPPGSDDCRIAPAGADDYRDSGRNGTSPSQHSPHPGASSAEIGAVDYGMNLTEFI